MDSNVGYDFKKNNSKLKLARKKQVSSTNPCISTFTYFEGLSLTSRPHLPMLENFKVGSSSLPCQLRKTAIFVLRQQTSGSACKVS